MSKNHFQKAALDTEELIVALQDELAESSDREEAEWAAQRQRWRGASLLFKEHLSMPSSSAPFEAPLCEAPLCEAPPCEAPACEAPACEAPISEAPACDDARDSTWQDEDDADEAEGEDEQAITKSSTTRRYSQLPDRRAEDGPGGEEGEEAEQWSEERPAATTRDALRAATTAQARRIYAPTWAFIAWDLDRRWFEQALDYFFSKRRWPPSSHLPAPIREACDDICLSLKELYVQEPFPPTYVAVLRDLDKDWFDWTIDQFFSSGHWPNFCEIPKTLQEACLDLGMASRRLNFSSNGQKKHQDSLVLRPFCELNVPCT